MTRVLLDTNVWLCMQAMPERLSDSTKALLVSPDTECVFSSVVAWEIAIKYRIGKLKLPLSPEPYVNDRLQRMPMNQLPIELRHALRVSELELHHADPFDRLLIAQAICEDLPIVTSDRLFSKYPITVIAS